MLSRETEIELSKKMLQDNNNQANSSVTITKEEIEKKSDTPVRSESIAHTSECNFDSLNISTPPLREPYINALEFCKVCETQEHILIDCPALKAIFVKKVCPICLKDHDWQQCPTALDHFVNKNYSQRNSYLRKFYPRFNRRDKSYHTPNNNYFQQQPANNFQCNCYHNGHFFRPTRTGSCSFNKHYTGY